MLCNFMCNCQVSLKTPITAPNNTNPSAFLSSSPRGKESRWEKQSPTLVTRGSGAWAGGSKERQEGQGPAWKKRKASGYVTGQLVQRPPVLTGFPLRKIDCNALVHPPPLRPQQYMHTAPRGETRKCPTSFPNSSKIPNQILNFPLLNWLY